MNTSSNPTKQQVINFVNNATPIFLGQHKFQQLDLPIGKDNILTLLFNITRPSSNDVQDYQRYNLSDYRKFNRMVDDFCIYLENHLPLKNEIRMKEITFSGGHTTCIYVDVKVNHH